MPTLPISVPYSFATSTSSIPLAYLDSNFSTITTALNGIGSGTTPLSAVNITGGSITGVAGVLSLDANNNITIPGTYVMGSSFLRNRLINGAMAIDQRNNGAALSIPAASAAYTVDRWYGTVSGAAISFQRVAGPSGYQYAMQITGAASNTSVLLGQRIESVNIADLASKQVTIGFTASSTSLTSLTYSLRYPNAVDDWSASTVITSNTVTISSTATYYSVQVTLPANVANGLSLDFIAASGITSGVLVITGVQLEQGSIGTPFERRSYGQELALCQRYFFDPVFGASSPVAYVQVVYNATTTLTNVSSSSFPVTMRTTPTLAYRNSTGVNSSAFSLVPLSSNTWYSRITPAAGGQAYATFNMTASAEL